MRVSLTVQDIAWFFNHLKVLLALNIVRLLYPTQTFPWSKKHLIKPGAHYPELPSSLLTICITLSHIFLCLEAPPTGFFVGVYIIANHKRAVVLYCLHHMQRRNRGQPLPLATNFCQGVKQTSACFRGKLKNPPPPHISKEKNTIRDMVDSRVQLVWRLWVMGS